MDRYFRKIGLNPARIGPLECLTYIGTHVIGALSFEPCVAEIQTSENIPLPQLAQEVQEVLKGEGSEFLQHLLVMGDSPQGARPKALVYRDPVNLEFEPYRVCRRLNILRDYSDEKTKLYPRN